MDLINFFLIRILGKNLITSNVSSYHFSDILGENLQLPRTFLGTLVAAKDEAQLFNLGELFRRTRR